MEYIKVSEAAAKWGLSARRVRVLCAEGRIGGVVRKENLYMIPADALRPTDGRQRTATSGHGIDLTDNVRISLYLSEITIRRIYDDRFLKCIKEHWKRKTQEHYCSNQRHNCTVYKSDLLTTCY